MNKKGIINYMKTNTDFPSIHYLLLTIMAITIIALTGCSNLPSSTDTAEVLTESADDGEITVGSHLAVKDSDQRLTLLYNMDALAADGLYHASWSVGDPELYVNSDGENVDLYDAQLYLLLEEMKSKESAQDMMDTWLDASRTNYEVTGEDTIDCNGQQYLFITYNVINPDSPYARGISAFGVYGDTAVCIELTCQDNYTEDLHELLVNFLNGCFYH